MFLIKVEENTITNLLETDATHVIPHDNIVIGDDIRMYDKNWGKRPLLEIVNDGLVTLANDEKVDGESIVKMTRYEMVMAGKSELLDYEYVDEKNKEVKVGTLEELLEFGRITQDRYIEILSEAARVKRDALLVDVDKIAGNPLRYAELSEEHKTELSVYRIELLNVPQQSGFPINIVWPSVPEQLLQ